MDLGPPSDWHYLAEGGANIVLSYHGPDPELQSQVLRLRKQSQPKTNSSNSQDPSVFLYQVVVSKLFPDHAARLREVSLSPGFLQEGQPVWEVSRPAERRQSDALDTARTKAVLAESMVQAGHSDSPGVLAIEIKPKWGFMPHTQYLSAETREAKLKHCRFCRHSRHRERPTKYCPLDLFSQNVARVKKGLLALYEDWQKSQGATNNFRVFVDGHQVSPDRLEPLQDALFKLDLCRTSTSHDEALDSQLTSILAPALAASPTLQRLNTLQAACDPIDIEGLAMLLQERAGLDLSHFKADESFLSALQDAGLGGEPTQEELEDLVDLLQRSSSLSATRDLRFLLVAYLFSAAFKDCSFFVSLPLGGRLQEPSLKLVDVDLKSMCRLPHYFALDQQLARVSV